MFKRLAVACAALAFAGACASSHEARVSPQQLARVPAQELGGVNQRRMDVASAQDEVARRELVVQSAKNELTLARQEVKAAEVDFNRAQTALDNASFDRNSAAYQRAANELTALQARRDAASAHVRAAEARLKLSKAEREDAQQRVELARAELQWEQFRALRDARAPGAYEINPDRLLGQVRREQNDVRDAEFQVARRQSDFTREQQRWRASAQRYESLRGYGGAGYGGGSGYGAGPGNDGYPR